MLDYIQGKVVELSPASVVIETGGLGYIANISLNTFTALSDQKEAKIYTYEAIREDAHILFGFSDKRERSLFLLLISVSGVGPNTARVALSSMAVSELENAIAGGNANLLKTMKGIGSKTAERIIIDLKDKIKLSEESASGQTTAPVSQAASEAVSALMMLGFNQVASQKVVNKIHKENPQWPVEQIIKSALKML